MGRQRRAHPRAPQSPAEHPHRPPRQRRIARAAPPPPPPPTSPGANGKDAAPNGQGAAPPRPRLDQPATTELVRLPAHETVRVTQDNPELKQKVAAIMAGRSEFVQV